MMRVAVFCAILALSAGAAVADPGDLLWTKVYNGPGNDFDLPVAVGVDDGGNVIVVGYGPGGATAFDVFVIKYAANGDQVWAKAINGSGPSNEIAYDGAVDGDGNTYFVASSGTYPNYDILTVKLDPAGDVAWREVYAGAGGGEDAPAAIAIDGSGNVYVCGRISGSSGEDCVTIKYTPTGSQAWATVYDGGYGADKPAAIAVDGSGNVYVCGSSTRADGIADFLTVKYGSGGGQSWATTFGRADTGDDAAADIAVDGSGNVYVTGKSQEAPGQVDHDYLTVKYDGTGADQWSQVYRTSKTDEPAAIALDNAGNVIVTGASGSYRGDLDFATVKYSPAGAELWVARHRGLGNADDLPADLLVDADNNIFVAGTVIGVNNNADFCVLRYTSGAGLRWSAYYNGSFNNDDQGVAVTLDGSKNVFVTGASFGQGTGYDIATLKFEANGIGLAAEPGVGLRGLRFELAPNPARQSAGVRLAAGRPGPVEVGLHDATGRLVSSLTTLTDGASRQVRLETAGLARGVYLVRVSTPDGVGTGKLILE